MSISRASIKKIIKDSQNLKMTDGAAEAIAAMLEEKAARIAKYAVERAKKNNRDAVLAEDVDSYRMKFGD
ncbi:MAG: NFYB/HAP3 family transcription factor subunit [Candidatus Marsarchaeota archaeon]|jgi:histone H3/H4|nr:NFYB/HAP3 family transcription factor subunit [Candidatus Marsarchaeota archaeon]